jgi:diadenylate cyclase
MPPFLAPILAKLTVKSMIDIVIVAVLIYQFVLSIRGRHAAHILTGICVLLALYMGAVWLQLELLHGLLSALGPYLAIAVIVMFQSEIRRLLARIGRFRWLGLGGRLERREIVDDIVLAVEQMSESKVGALIVVERDIGLRTFVESGVAMNALVSRDLLCSIFQRGGALHDGAAIIQGDRLAAAACFLPLTTNPGMARRLGTRHRAAIGVTEESDALAIAVSEETGQISLAVRGDLEADVSLARLREWLTRYTLGRPQFRDAHPRVVSKQTGP